MCRRRRRCESVSYKPNISIHARMTLGHQQGVKLRVLQLCNMNRGRLYEPIGVKNIALCAL